MHQLERVIHAGPIRSDRGRRRDEKILISGALTLLTNAVIAYNTWKLHEVLERRRVAGRDVPPETILAHIAPVGFRHINFHGVYRFSPGPIPLPPHAVRNTSNNRRWRVTRVELIHKKPHQFARIRKHPRD